MLLSMFEWRSNGYTRHTPRPHRGSETDALNICSGRPFPSWNPDPKRHMHEMLAKLSFDGTEVVSGILNTRDDGTCGWFTGCHVAQFLVVFGRFAFSITRCHVVRKGGTLVCGFVQMKMKFGKLLT